MAFLLEERKKSGVLIPKVWLEVHAHQMHVHVVTDTLQVFFIQALIFTVFSENLDLDCIFFITRDYFHDEDMLFYKFDDLLLPLFGQKAFETV